MKVYDFSIKYHYRYNDILLEKNKLLLIITVRCAAITLVTVLAWFL